MSKEVDYRSGQFLHFFPCPAKTLLEQVDSLQQAEIRVLAPPRFIPPFHIPAFRGRTPNPFFGRPRLPVPSTHQVNNEPSVLAESGPSSITNSELQQLGGAEVGVTELDWRDGNLFVGTVDDIEI